MEYLINKLKEFRGKSFSYDKLGDFVYNYPFEDLSYKELLPDRSADESYTRNIICEDPIELVILRWPPGSESAVHHHEGFYGYVVVLEGKAQDIVYENRGDVISDYRISHCFKTGIIDEPDGVVHKIINSDPDKELITLHIYYPALINLDGLRIFDLENECIGTLNHRAKTASWEEEASCFKNIELNAFKHRHFSEEHPAVSHRMVVVKPKPEPDMIRTLLAGYYDEQAHVYDYFDFKHPTRKAYTRKINEIIAIDLKKSIGVNNFLCIASGTGRRILDIRQQSGLNFRITGVDMSSEMNEISREKGINSITSSWMNVSISGKFQAASFLYAFGHIPNREERLKSLKKINRFLETGSPFYFDVFNIEDRYEWGPRVAKHYTQYNLHRSGYQKGDIFYQKTGGNTLAYVHYFNVPELLDLLTESGFKAESIQYVGYVSNSGKIVKNQDEGFCFIKAVKEQEVN